MKIAVISANIGNYDSYNNVINIENYELFDWFYFTDNDKVIINGWKIIKPTYHNNDRVNNNDYVNNNDRVNDNDYVNNMMIAKYYKLQFLKIDILQTYDYIVWMDASIHINNINFCNDIILLLSNKKNYIYIFEHYIRNSIKAEYIASLKFKKYKDQDMFKQITDYYNTKFKNLKFKDSKLYECGFFIVKNNSSIEKLLDDWWNEVIKYTFQDQLSFPYVLWKNKIIPYSLNNNINKNIYNNKLIGIVKPHKIIISI